MNSAPILLHFDTAAFLRDFWQQRPCLIKAPWTAWTNPLEPDDLAGLACEAEVESRLVIGGAGQWAVEHGPFSEDRFATLGGAPWTLLVQAVDHQVPDVAALITPFRFIPNWRIDDVMVSYASDGGGVGPHFDQYDVFLIQGHGRRRWRVGQFCDETSPLLRHDDLRLLAEFHATDEWLLEPGDILYVPPGFAHDGVAVGDDCMTYSIGFRAPARSELITGFCDELVTDMIEDDRYRDGGLLAPPNPGEIDTQALAKLHAMVTEAMSDAPTFARWFGQFNTTPKYPDVDWAPEEPISIDDLSTAIGRGVTLIRNPASRFAFVRTDPSHVVLFVDGESFDCEGDVAILAQRLCAADRISLDPVLARSGAAVTLLELLYNHGALAFEE